jgi:hypothetical protein
MLCKGLRGLLHHPGSSNLSRNILSPRSARDVGQSASLLRSDRSCFPCIATPAAHVAPSTKDGSARKGSNRFLGLYYAPLKCAALLCTAVVVCHQPGVSRAPPQAPNVTAGGKRGGGSCLGPRQRATFRPPAGLWARRQFNEVIIF